MTTLAPTKQDDSVAQEKLKIGSYPDAPIVGLRISAANQSNGTAAAIAHALQVGADNASGDTAQSALQAEFDTLAKKWQAEAQYLSSPNAIAGHSAYQQIIGMGKPVVPLILRDLQATQAQWFWALQAITRESPVRQENRGDIEAMTADWIAWGKRHQYI